MAHFKFQISSFILLLSLAVVFFLSTATAQARVNNFFSEQVRDNSINAKKKTIAIANPPSSAVEDGDPIPYSTGVGNGYGLYPHPNGRIPSTTTNSDWEKFDDEVFDTEYYDMMNNNNNKKNNQNYYNGDVKQQFGMSDTRYMDNGKYFFDVKGDGSNGHVRYDGSSNGWYKREGGGQTQGFGNGEKERNFPYGYDNQYMEGSYQKESPETEEGYVP